MLAVVQPLVALAIAVRGVRPACLDLTHATPCLEELMYLIWSLSLIVCGILAAASFIVTKRPDAKKLIDQLTPVQGWVGTVVCCLGLWSLVQMLLHVSIMRHAPLTYFIALATGCAMTLLGFTLGYGLINRYALSKNPEAAERGVAVQQKLLTIQVPLGLAGIALGVFGLVTAFIH
jgi:hypothetical protein